MSDTCQPGSSGSSTHTHTHTHIHTLLNTDAIWPHACAHTHTHLHSAPSCVRLAYITRTSRRTHLSDSQSNILSASRRHPDTCHGEHTVTHQNTTQCNSILAVISKKSPPSQNASPPKRLSGKLTLPWKKLSHTHTHTHTHTDDSVSIPLVSLH